ncbi:tetratricopeptide repeat protein [Undibacterium cyanobacteriorum]|uniref:Tetratricopeptide repeat protein n=1 Tax=Undibacterium cyanobacteriorum TaxID=3073561 RepID=A0ABY9RKU2_9BURK|nr:tetratricopeptide repeat protein [Undibacterium sp. 20NA77.5]WMW81454.1 tetratricopeptide repeat protein [Undibacterium sp. 20NA77.5]
MLKTLFSIFKKENTPTRALDVASTKGNTAHQSGSPQANSVPQPFTREQIDELFTRAGQSLDRGDTVTALDMYLTVLKHVPDFEKAHVMAGFLYQQRGNLTQAKHHLQTALSLNPQLADAHYLLGVIASAEGQRDVLRHNYRASLKLSPHQEHIYLALAFDLHQTQELDASISVAKEGLLCFPNSKPLWASLGNFYYLQKDMLAAHDAYVQARQEDNLDLGLEYNYAMVLSILGQPMNAMEALDRIIKRDPQHVMAHFQRGVLSLQCGQFKEGWQEFEWRWQMPALREVRFKSARERWDGSQDLRDKTILVLSEQGYGDTIQFCRFIPELASRGAQVIFVVLGPLKELMVQIPSVAILLDETAPLPEYDYYCELMSLPRALGIELGDIPNQPSYLAAPVTSVQKWKGILGATDRMRVGFVWSGNPQHANDAYRSIPLTEARAAFAFDAEFIVLVKDLNPDAKADLDSVPQVRHFGAQVGGFADTAALIDQVDVVLTVDTSVAHLAGAMGKRTYVLLSYHADWRWLLEREDSPWYPSVTLVRQGFGQPWSAVIDHTCAEILKLPRLH